MEHTNEHGLTRCQIWKQRLQDLQASGLTQKEWCQQNQIPMTTLRYWKRKFKTSESPSSSAREWMSLGSLIDAAETNPADTILQKAGVRIIISGQADPVLTGNLIRVLLGL